MESNWDIQRYLKLMVAQHLSEMLPVLCNVSQYNICFQHVSFQMHNQVMSRECHRLMES